MNPELRGDAEKTFDVEQADAEGREFEAEYLAEVAEEQDQAWKPGDLVDITIRNARVIAGGIPEADYRFVEYDVGRHDTPTSKVGVCFGSRAVTVTPAAPEHWPPLVGELWGGYTGIGTYTVLLAVDAQAAIGEPAEALVADSGASYSPAAARHQFTSLHRVYPDGGDGDE